VCLLASCLHCLPPHTCARPPWGPTACLHTWCDSRRHPDGPVDGPTPLSVMKLLHDKSIKLLLCQLAPERTRVMCTHLQQLQDEEVRHLPHLLVNMASTFVTTLALSMAMTNCYCWASWAAQVKVRKDMRLMAVDLSGGRAPPPHHFVFALDERCVCRSLGTTKKGEVLAELVPTTSRCCEHCWGALAPHGGRVNREVAVGMSAMCRYMVCDSRRMTLLPSLMSQCIHDWRAVDRAQCCIQHLHYRPTNGNRAGQQQRPCVRT
jgi:hypothetical protein